MDKLSVKEYANPFSKAEQEALKRTKTNEEFINNIK